MSGSSSASTASTAPRLTRCWVSPPTRLARWPGTESPGSGAPKTARSRCATSPGLPPRIRPVRRRRGVLLGRSHLEGQRRLQLADPGAVDVSPPVRADEPRLLGATRAGHQGAAHLGRPSTPAGAAREGQGQGADAQLPEHRPHTRTLPRAQRSSATALVKTSVYSARVVRIAAAGLTVFLILTPLTVGVDLLAWQCYREGAAGCPSLPDFFDFFTNDYFSSSPAATPRRRLRPGAARHPPALAAVSAVVVPLRVRDDDAGEARRRASGGPPRTVRCCWTRPCGRARAGPSDFDACTSPCACASSSATPPSRCWARPTWTGRSEMSLIDARSWFVWVDGALTLAAAVVGLVVVFVLLPRVRPGDLESNDLLLAHRSWSSRARSTSGWSAPSPCSPVSTSSSCS